MYVNFLLYLCSRILTINFYMKKLLVILLSCLCIAAQGKEYAYQSVDGDPMGARIYRLENGLTVYLTQNKTEPVIQTFIAVRAGAQNDPLESTGLAHYQEHIMFKGTKSYGTTDYEKELPNLLAIDSLYEIYGKTADEKERKAIYHLIDSFSYESSKIAIANEFDKLMSGIGASGVNAYTSTDRTCYHEVIPSGELVRWAMIESDRFRNLVIRGFHTELEAVYEEYNLSTTNDFRKAHLALNQILYPNIPYRQHTVLGTQEDLKNPSIKNIRAFYDTYYRPNNVAICLSGDFEFDHAIEVIDAYFGKWEAKEIPAPARYEQPSLKGHKDTVVYGKEAPEVYMAWKLPDVKDKDMDALEVLDYILQNGKCGLLDVDIEQKQTLLSVSSMLWDGVDYSTYYLIGSPKEKQSLEEVRTILLAEIDKLKKGDFSEELIPAILRNKKRTELVQLQYNSTRVDKFIDAHIYDIPYEEIVHNMARKEKITKEDVVRVANAYFTDSYACVLKEHNEDSNPPKMEKPQITPIEMNREQTSEFYNRLMVIPSERNEPQFLDFEKDIQKTKLASDVELLYRQNTENDLSKLVFITKKGTDQDPYLGMGAGLLSYLGTDKMTTEQYQTALYREAAEAWVSSSDNESYFYLYGLKESLPNALALMEEHVLTAKGDEAVLAELINDRIKAHEDAKKDQRICFSQLTAYGFYGAEANKNRILPPKQMRKVHSEDLLVRIRELVPAIERVVYYGPLPEDEVIKMLASSQLLAKANPAVRKEPKHIEIQEVHKNEVLIAPYKANNVYICAYANWGETYNPKERAAIALFNEYFDGSMGGIVFQEMREARALCYASWAEYCMADYKGEKNYMQKGVMSQNDKLKDCIMTLDMLCNDMPVSQAAFDNAKEALIKQIEQRRFVRENAIWSYINFEELGWEYDIFKDVYEEVKKMTIDDVLQFQKEHVANHTWRYMILGDPKELDNTFLKNLGKVKNVSLKDIFVY